MTKSLIYFLFLFSITIISESFAQNIIEGNRNYFYFDAVVFKSTTEVAGRVDVFTLVPYQSLDFIKSGEKYGAKYSLNITIHDSDGKKVFEKLVNRKISEEDYNLAQGEAAGFDNTQFSCDLVDGKYKIKVVLRDELTNQEFSKSRTITVLKFDDFPFAMSGVMLLSSIEAKGDRFVITPHIDDNIGNISDDFFTFFEIYNDTDIKEVDLIYQFLDNNNNTIVNGTKIRKSIDTLTSQQYLKITKPKNLTPGEYILQLIALKPTDTEDFNESDFLAIAQRSLKFMHSVGGTVLNDLDKAIRQLRYAATSDEWDYIKDARTEEEKKKRFDEFWRGKDPIPNTQNNEAFEEFYSRVAIANKLYKSYAEGWLTDMGTVYIILGQPNNVQKYNNYGDRRVFEKWTYGNGYDYIFVDNSGFGDFRLSQPISITEKYKYNK